MISAMFSQNTVERITKRNTTERKVAGGGGSAFRCVYVGLDVTIQSQHSPFTGGGFPSFPKRRNVILPKGPTQGSRFSSLVAGGGAPAGGFRPARIQMYVCYIAHPPHLTFHRSAGGLAEESADMIMFFEDIPESLYSH